MEGVLLLSILVAGLFARLPFSVLASNDEWVVFAHMERQARGRWLTYDVPNAVFEGRDGYPILLHFLLSRLPRSMWGWLGRLLNSGYDLLTGVLVYATTAQVVRENNVAGQLAGISLPLAACALFLFAPILFSATSRLRTINARTAGLPVTTGYFLLAFGYVSSGSAAWHPAAWVWLAPLLVLGALLYALSMFAVQCMVFFMIVLAAWYRDPVLALLPFGSLALCWPARFGIRPALGHHWNFKVWYWRNWSKGTSAAARNTWAGVRDLWRRRRQPQAWANYLTQQNSLAIALIGFPGAVLVLPAVFQPGGLDAADPSGFLEFSLAVFAAALGCFILTSIPRLTFLGQAERYFEYSLPFVAVLLVFELASAPGGAGTTWFWALLLFHVAGCSFNFLQPHFGKVLSPSYPIEPELRDLCAFVSRECPGARVLTNPVKLAYVLSFLSYRNTLPPSVRLYYRFFLRPGETGYRYFERDMASPFGHDLEAFINRDPAAMADEYGLTHLVLEKSRLRSFDPRSPYRRLAEDPKRILYENDSYALIDLRDLPPE